MERGYVRERAAVARRGEHVGRAGCMGRRAWVDGDPYRPSERTSRRRGPGFEAATRPAGHPRFFSVFFFFFFLISPKPTPARLSAKKRLFSSKVATFRTFFSRTGHARDKRFSPPGSPFLAPSPRFCFSALRRRKVRFFVRKTPKVAHFFDLFYTL